MPIAVIAALIALIPNGARAQAPAKAQADLQLTLDEVVQRLVLRNAERAKALASYHGRRIYVLDYTGFPMALHGELTVDMNYSAPATKEFKVVSETGNKWIVDRILKRLIETEREALDAGNRDSVALNPRNYDFKMLDHECSNDTCSYILGVEPKVPNKFLYRGRIWVDATDFAVSRVEAEPAQNPSFWIRKTVIHHSYEKVGDFWLPAENESVSSLRLDGRATLTIKYENYEINPVHAVKDANPAPAGH